MSGASKNMERKKKIKRRRRILLMLIIIVISMPLIYVIKNKIEDNSSVKYLDSMGVKKYKISDFKEKLDEYEKEIDIKEIDYGFNGNLEGNNKPKTIIFHHTGTSVVTPEAINEDHKEKGYEGIGYHFYIRKDGTIYRGRPEEAIGAHAYGKNYGTLGVCIEGDLEDEYITDAQINSLVKLSTDMIIKYNIEDCVGHKDVFETLCPGENFPMDNIKERIKEELIKVDSN